MDGMGKFGMIVKGMEGIVVGMGRVGVKRGVKSGIGRVVSAGGDVKVADAVANNWAKGSTGVDG